MNFYDILELPTNATPQQIRQSYRHKAKQLHPDYNPRESAFFEIVQLNLARDTLLDPDKRQAYNLHLQQLTTAPANTPTSRSSPSITITRFIKYLYTYHCKVCQLEMRSTWQGYCLYHFLEASGQLHHPDRSFLYHGQTYYWKDPEPPSHPQPPPHPFWIILLLILIITVVIMIFIFYQSQIINLL